MMTGILDLEQMEALACREGLALATDLGLQKFRMATDCANVVKNIKGDGMGSYGQIIREINARTETFNSVDIVHEGRRSNIDAHMVARSCVSQSIGRHVWFLHAPPGVLYLLSCEP